MNEEIFRKKSLDKVKSPESLDDYIRVSDPGVWLLLVSVIVLLAGVCVWGVFGHIDSTVDIVVSAENGVLTGEVSDLTLTEGMILRVGELECEISDITYEADAAQMTGSFRAKADIPDGVYDAKLVTERHKPLSFVLN